jgi:hypothetical protein
MKHFGIGHVREWRRYVFKTVQVLVVIPVSLFHQQMDNSCKHMNTQSGVESVFTYGTSFEIYPHCSTRNIIKGDC